MSQEPTPPSEVIPPPGNARRLPEGVDGDKVLTALPFLRPWIHPTQNLGAEPPRDFIHSPFALSSLGLGPTDPSPLDGVTTQPMAVQAVLREYYRRMSTILGAYDPLHACIVLNDAQGAAEAAKTSPLSLCGPHGHTPLTLASALGRAELVEVLLQAGTPLQSSDVLNSTPLHWAAIIDDRALMERLTHAGADEKAQNVMGALPADYTSGWQRELPGEPGIPILHSDGTWYTPSSAAAFRAQFGYDYLGESRPGVDFFVQLAVGMHQPIWVETVTKELARVGFFTPAMAPSTPLYLKDFGHPWGWGVCTREPIPEGTPVTTYEGDLIHTFEMTIDMFNLGFSLYTCNTQPTNALQNSFLCHFDARRSGNLGSRINSAHADGFENLRSKSRFCRGLPMNLFTSARDIEKDEQLCWWYGPGYWKARGVEALPLPKF